MSQTIALVIRHAFHSEYVLCIYLGLQRLVYIHAVYDAVVFYCHSRSSIENRLIFHAQDLDMTSGDFVFFTSHPQRSSSTDRPWDRYVDDPEDRPYRRRAYYAVKEVSSCFPVLSMCLSCSENHICLCMLTCFLTVVYNFGRISLYVCLSENNFRKP